MKLKKRAATRWNSLHDVLERFLLLHDELLVMELKGCFKTCKSPVHVPLPDAAPKIQALVDELKIIKVVGRLLESREVFTLPHLPFMVHTLLSKLSEERDWEFAEVKAIRKALHDSIVRRLGKHINDPTQPSLLAALLMPHYAGRLHEFVKADVGKTAIDNLVQWFTDLQVDAAVVDDDDVDVDNASATTFLSPEPVRRLTPRDVVTRFFRFITQRRVVDLHPLPSLDCENFKKQANETAVFYRQLPEDHRSIIPLFKCLMSGWGSSAGESLNILTFRLIIWFCAGAEQAFSASGRINSPFRTRMSPTMLEQLTGFFFCPRRGVSLNQNRTQLRNSTSLILQNL